MAIIITFGQIHVHRIADKTFDADCVARIECTSYAEGRRKAFELFGSKWCFAYEEKDFGEDKLCHFPRGIIDIS